MNIIPIVVNLQRIKKHPIIHSKPPNPPENTAIKIKMGSIGTNNAVNMKWSATSTKAKG